MSCTIALFCFRITLCYLVLASVPVALYISTWVRDALDREFKSCLTIMILSVIHFVIIFIKQVIEFLVLINNIDQGIYFMHV